MKNPARLLLTLGLAFAFAGCQHLDLTPESDPQRVVSGTVKLNAEVLFQPDAVAIVRVVDLTPSDRAQSPVAKDLPVADLTRDEPKVERVLGEQVIRAPGATPIPFRVEFQADDATMRRGLVIDVRISEDGKLHYRTLNAHMITLASLAYPQEVSADLVR